MIGLYQYLNGAIMTGYFVIAAFFLRFRLRSRDQLFTFFSVAFFMFGLEKVIFAFNGDPNREGSAAFYLIRLAGFVLILVGIINKNRGKAA